jgi:hypothetical protein
VPAGSWTRSKRASRWVTIHGLRSNRLPANVLSLKGLPPATRVDLEHFVELLIPTRRCMRWRRASEGRHARQANPLHRSTRSRSEASASDMVQTGPVLGLAAIERRAALRLRDRFQTSRSDVMFEGCHGPGAALLPSLRHGVEP